MEKNGGLLVRSPRCKLYIVMAKTGKDDEQRHKHSMFLVSVSGIEVLRAMTVYGHDDAPHGHMHIKFKNVGFLKKIYC